MSDRNECGPAFPASFRNTGDSDTRGFAGEVVPPQHGVNYSGMTLRDYFAAKFAAAQLTTTSADTDYFKPDLLHSEETAAQTVARIAYAVADAMVEARKK